MNCVDWVHHDSVTTANPKYPVTMVERIESKKPQTNADRIRAMDDEDLAVEMAAKGGCPHDCEEPENMDTDCVKCWLDWLRQEAVQDARDGP